MQVSEKKSWLLSLIIRISIVLGLFISIFFIRNYYFYDVITFENIKNNAYTLRAYVENNYALSVVGFIGIYIVIALCALPLAALATIVGGFLYGALLGALYTNIGATIGATILLLLMRYAIGSYFQAQYAEKLTYFNQKIEKDGWLYLLIIRLFPFMPFFMVNVLAGLTQVSVFTFVWTTSVGIFPTSLLYAYAGKQLTTMNNMNDIFSGHMIAILMLLILLMLIPIVMQRLKKWLRL